ncbi:unnamed protein product [Closterium sp. Yama58-4]|nr:unnamed protein product [Closterium sp. Yama58-4]
MDWLNHLKKPQLYAVLAQALLGASTGHVTVARVPRDGWFCREHGAWHAAGEDCEGREGSGGVSGGGGDGSGSGEGLRGVGREGREGSVGRDGLGPRAGDGMGNGGVGIESGGEDRRNGQLSRLSGQQGEDSSGETQVNGQVDTQQPLLQQQQVTGRDTWHELDESEVWPPQLESHVIWASAGVAAAPLARARAAGVAGMEDRAAAAGGAAAAAGAGAAAGAAAGAGEGGGGVGGEGEGEGAGAAGEGGGGGGLNSERAGRRQRMGGWWGRGVRGTGTGPGGVGTGGAGAGVGDAGAGMGATEQQQFQQQQQQQQQYQQQQQEQGGQRGGASGGGEECVEARMNMGALSLAFQKHLALLVRAERNRSSEALRLLVCSEAVPSILSWLTSAESTREDQMLLRQLLMAVRVAASEEAGGLDWWSGVKCFYSKRVTFKRDKAAPVASAPTPTPAPTTIELAPVTT